MLARMKLAALPLIAALVLALPACKTGTPGPGAALDPPVPANPQPAAAGDFSFYLLNLSWSPEYCHSHSKAAECTRHSTFVLHGLWPQNDSSEHLENCGNQPGPDPSQFSDIYPDPGLLQHEWSTHGTCSGLAPNDFFSAARTAYQSIKIPSQLANLSTQTSLSPDQIASLFTQANSSLPREAVAISCGNNYLTAVEICLDKSFHPMACPAVVRSCRANSVRIPAPQ